MDYRIVCTVQVPPHTSGHIIKVGTNPNLDSYSKLWTVSEALAAIRAGHTFHTLSPSTGKPANIEIYPCPAHGRTTSVRHRTPSPTTTSTA